MMAQAPGPRNKVCKACRSPYVAFRPLQKACGPVCAQKLAQAQREKAEYKVQMKAERDQREKLKTRADWMREAQSAFNAWIRRRDAALPCVSCGRHHGGKWNAGHYLSTGARPELRFDEANVQKQCEPCNTHLHGNLVLYRAELIRRVGQIVVERLEGPHAPRKYTADDLKAIRDTYRRRARALEM